jgi:hydrogenase maturation protease
MTPPANSSPSAGNSVRPVLVYGYGNPGRQDDGLGVALVEQLAAWAASEHLPGLTFDSNYQLNVEDALAIAGHDLVIFADATGEGADAFSFRRLAPHATIAFSTHAMAPESVLALCAELYGKQPPTWLLTIRGFAWEPNAAVTTAAQANLAAALAFLKTWLRGPSAV